MTDASGFQRGQKQGGKDAASEERARALIDNAMAELRAMSDTLRDNLKALGIDTDNLQEEAKAGFVSLEKSIAREVSERPLHALASVGLVGFLVGLCWRR